MTAPKTGQPKPRTSSRERLKAAESPIPLDHDRRRDHRPDRHQDAAGNDQEDEAEELADRGEDAGPTRVVSTGLTEPNSSPTEVSRGPVAGRR